MNIDWSKIGQEDKAKCFWEALRVEPEPDYWYCKLDAGDGRIGDACPTQYDAECHKRHLEERFQSPHVITVHSHKSYPPLTLDALFQWCDENDIQVEIGNYEDNEGIKYRAAVWERHGKTCFSDDESDNFLDLLSAAILRFKGHTVI